MDVHIPMLAHGLIKQLKLEEAWSYHGNGACHPIQSAQGSTFAPLVTYGPGNTYPIFDLRENVHGPILLGCGHYTDY